jgi:hypothetical protein
MGRVSSFCKKCSVEKSNHGSATVAANDSIDVSSTAFSESSANPLAPVMSSHKPRGLARRSCIFAKVGEPVKSTSPCNASLFERRDHRPEERVDDQSCADG